MEQLIGLQIHNHSHTCRKPCRFGFPRPPLPEIKKYRLNFKKVTDFLKNLGLKFKEDLNFNEFLSRLGLTMEDYMMAIRSSIKRDVIFKTTNL